MGHLLISSDMISFAVLLLLICAPIMGQIPHLLNATVGGSVLMPCSITVYPVSLIWFYWQQDQSDNLLFHWDTKKPTQTIADQYKNRCRVFEAEFTSGNISIKLDSVTALEDQKTFWAYASFYDEQKKVNKQCQKCCKFKLQVSAPYQDLQPIVNCTANSATCTARGGFPQPQVSWMGRNKSSAAQLDLKDAVTGLQRDPKEGTFTVTSSVSVNGLQDVTCHIYNPRTRERMNRTAEISGCDEVEQKRLHVAFGVVGGICLLMLTGLALNAYCHRRRQNDRMV